MGLAFLLVAVGTALFAPAGTLAYWQAWLFRGVFGTAVAAITIYLAARDPELLARRVHAGPSAEPRRGQQIVQAFASLAFLCVFAVAGLRHPMYAGALLLILGVPLATGSWCARLVVPQAYRASVRYRLVPHVW